jgi:hypothetical protein
MLSQENERCVYPRLPAPKGTIVAWHKFNKKAVSVVDNLGLGGLYIRTPDPPATGTFIQLLLDVPTKEVRAGRSAKKQAPRGHVREVRIHGTGRSGAIRGLA